METKRTVETILGWPLKKGNIEKRWHLQRFFVIELFQVDTMESDCSKRHKIDYETCTNLTEVSQQKCTICKVVISLAFFRNPPMSPPLLNVYLKTRNLIPIF